MTKLDADTLLAKIDNETPLSADDFQDKMAYAAKTSWCDKAYKERFEEAATGPHGVQDVIDQTSQALGDHDPTEMALALLDIAKDSGQLSETQEDELSDLRSWIEENGADHLSR